MLEFLISIDSFNYKLNVDGSLSSLIQTFPLHFRPTHPTASLIPQLVCQKAIQTHINIQAYDLHPHSCPQMWSSSRDPLSGMPPSHPDIKARKSQDTFLTPPSRALPQVCGFTFLLSTPLSLSAPRQPRYQLLSPGRRRSHLISLCHCSHSALSCSQNHF